MKAFATIICLLAYISTVRTLTRCQLDKNTALMLNNIPPILRTLGVELSKLKTFMVNKWLKNRQHELSDIQFTVASTSQPNINKTTPQGKLEINRRILEAYVPYIRKFERHYGAFSAARDVTNRLQEIKWTVENVIYSSQVIQRVLMKNSGQPSTAVVSPTKSAVINSPSSSRGVPTSAQTSASVVQAATPSANTLTLHGIALRAAAMLDDLYIHLLPIRADFIILARTLC